MEEYAALPVTDNCPIRRICLRRAVLIMKDRGAPAFARELAEHTIEHAARLHVDVGGTTVSAAQCEQNCEAGGIVDSRSTGDVGIAPLRLADDTTVTLGDCREL